MYINDIITQAKENYPDLTESELYIVNYGNSVDGFMFVGLKDYSEIQNNGYSEWH